MTTPRLDPKKYTIKLNYAHIDQGDGDDPMDGNSGTINGIPVVFTEVFDGTSFNAYYKDMTYAKIVLTPGEFSELLQGNSVTIYES